MSANPTWKGKLRAACTVLVHSPHELEDNVVHMLGLPASALTSPESFSDCVHATAATILYEVILGVCDVNPAISIAISKRLEQMTPGGQAVDVFAEVSTEEKLFVPDKEEVPPLLAEMKEHTRVLLSIERMLRRSTIIDSAISTTA